MAMLNAAGAGAQDLSEDYLKMLGRADSLIQKSEWDEAEECFMNAMRRHPDNPMNVLVMSNVGLMRHYAGRDSMAIEILDQAVEMAPNSVTVRSNRAKVRTSLGMLKEAADDYTRLLESDSTLTEPRHMRCIIALRTGDFNQAAADARYLEVNAPDSQAASETNAFVAMALNDYEKALLHFNALIKKEPVSANYGERALCNLMLGNYSEASSDLNDAIRLDPLNGDLYLYRAVLNKKRFRPADSMEDAKKAIELGVPRIKVAEMGL